MIVRSTLYALASRLMAPLHRRRAEARFQATVRAAHFHRLSVADEAKALFKASVRSVEIETFTYCNRVCWFCPNSFIDRRSTRKHMDEDLYLSILADLASVDYDGEITYSRYNEPLADRIILTRLRQARAAVPRARLATHSNGDYLDRAYLEELYDAGLRGLHVQAYLGNEERFDDAKVLARLRRRAGELGVPYVLLRARPGRSYEAKLFFRDMHLTLSAFNYDLHGCNRGGLLDVGPSRVRTAPCASVFGSVYVDWNGAVVPCCNIRSDAPDHASYVVDTLTPERGLIAVFADSPLVDWRRELIGWGEKRAPCDACRFAEVPETPAMRAFSAMVMRENGIG